jgi:hypothetical protein
MMAILMIWPILVIALVWLYRRSVLREVEQRNQRITQAYVDAVEQNLQFQREQFEASR